MYQIVQTLEVTPDKYKNDGRPYDRFVMCVPVLDNYNFHIFDNEGRTFLTITGTCEDRHVGHELYSSDMHFQTMCFQWTKHYIGLPEWVYLSEGETAKLLYTVVCTVPNTNDKNQYVRSLFLIETNKDHLEKRD